MNLLIIDDNMYNLEAFQVKLLRMKARNQLDYFLCGDSNLEDMERNLQENLPWLPSLIFLDVMIPPARDGDIEHRGGLVLLEKIKNGHYGKKILVETPVVLMSAIFDFEKVSEKYHGLIYDTLPKPFGIPQATKIIKNRKRELGE